MGLHLCLSDYYQLQPFLLLLSNQPIESWLHVRCCITPNLITSSLLLFLAVVLKVYAPSAPRLAVKAPDNLQALSPGFCLLFPKPVEIRN